MKLVGRTLEGKRNSSLQRWKEQRRTYHNNCFSPLAFIWAIVIICFLIRGTHLPTLHSIPATRGTYSSDAFTLSSSIDGSSREWDSAHREVHRDERNWVGEKISESGQALGNSLPDEDHHKLYNLVKSSPNLGLSFSREKKNRSSSLGNGLKLALNLEETPNVTKTEGLEEEDDDESRSLGHGTSGVEEDQGQAQLEEVVTTEDSTGIKTSTVEDSWVAHGLMQKVPQPCASVEEMGLAAAGDTKKASLRLRRTIRSYFAEHGAERVRQLSPDLFCARSFVLGKAQDDGFGNNMYKLLTAAGLSVILNRSLIIGESSSTNPGYIGSNKRPLRLPFGDYVSYSDQAFSMREVKQLWVDNDCSGKYNRSLVLKVDVFETPAHSTALCDDWTEWTHPILWFKDTQDTVALQFLLKNQHANLRSAAAFVLGDPSQPDSRPNTFGELMIAIVEPKPDVKEAVEWALKRRQDGDRWPWPEYSPDIALHLRMRNSASQSGPEAATFCITRILSELPIIAQKRPRIVVVSDTPSAVALIKRSILAPSADIISFDYKDFLSSATRSSNFSLRADAFLPPSKRKKDWGPLPRWVAVVDFFLAARVKHAVVSGAHRRVGTTYAQLVASLAAAYTLEGEEQRPARFYSSFQESLLVEGLVSQVGWGHSWHPFGGKLSCPKQPPQCALTPLLPYAWWDAPWQSPSKRDRRKMKVWGIIVESDGVVTDNSLQHFCRHRKKSAADSVLLALPKARS